MFDLLSQPAVYLPIIGVLGLLLGSFANVVILRLPAGESVVTPRSRCNSCKTQIGWKDNIPVISFLLLKGKCRACKTKISGRYPLVELTMGALFFAVAYSVGLSWSLIEYLIFVFGLVTITFIDIDHFIIPDVFSISGVVIGLLGAAINPEREFLSAVYGVLMGGGFLWLVAYLYYVLRKQEGMGGGDIKLIAWIGAVLGWPSVPFVILVSSLVGSIVGIIMMRSTKDGLKTVLPFGPFLAFGAVFYLLGGYRLAYQYLIIFFPWLEPIDI